MSNLRRRAHPYRPSPEYKPSPQYVTCPDCGKRGFAAKADAKRAARLAYPGQRLRVYRCGERWHITSQGASRIAVWRDWGAR